MAKYRDYFDINPRYFPQVDDSSLRAGLRWDDFFPHETFISLLENAERILARQKKSSVWIEGAYGTGKSHAAWALKNILDCPEEELRDWFARHDRLRTEKSDLLNRLIGHKGGGKIVAAHRYASSSVLGDRDLIRAVQESVRRALEEAGCECLGGETLRESVVKWIEKPVNKEYFNNLLRSDEWRNVFQRDADAVLAQLRGEGTVDDLMRHIFNLASREGITALDMDMDRLVKWLEEVIDRNGLKALVLVWDEFSEYFKKNADSLTEFQKLASLCQHKPFYLAVVTHQSGALFREQNPDWKKLRDRFHMAEITLPENIAFDLISHALEKKETARADWEKKQESLNSRMNKARKAVAAEAKVDERILRGIAPFHPMAAFLLVRIAGYFKSNQRSMFNFIKNHAGEGEVKAFQWFIAHHGPLDEQPFLTADHLWNFFYERGKDDLTPDIRAVLDVYPRVEERLDRNERRVLKAVLIMQAIGTRHGVELFRPTEANLALAFEGTDLESSPRAVGIAEKLVRDEILFKRPLGGGRTMFSAVTVAGGEELETLRKFIRENTNTGKLIAEGELGNLLTLSAAQRRRWDIQPAWADDFTRKWNALCGRAGEPWKMRAVICFARDETERDDLRRKIKEATAKEECAGILLIDALTVPLGRERFEDYVDNRASGQQWRGKDNQLADEMDAKGRNILTEWRDAIGNARFVIHGASSPGGTVAANGQQALTELTNAALRKYRLAFDALEVRDPLFDQSAKKADAEKGIKGDSLLSGASGMKERKVILEAWQVPEIREKIAAAVEEALGTAGRISLLDIANFLVELGFMPANLYGYLAGHLLKNYATEAYRWSDGSAAETMAPGKLAEAVAEAFKHLEQPIKNYRDKFIVRTTDEEKAFFALTAKTFGVDESQCASVEGTARLVTARMKDFAYPLWTLNDPVISDYLDLVKSQGAEQASIASRIGKAALSDAGLGERLGALASKESCRRGMESFLAAFEGGQATRLAAEIGADVLADAAAMFDAPDSLWLWDRETGEDRIRQLIVDYGITRASNAVNPRASSLRGACGEWRSRLNFVKMPCEALERELPSCGKLLAMLRDIASGELPLPPTERRQEFLDEITANESQIKSLFNDTTAHFRNIYRPYLEDLDEGEIAAIAEGLPNGVFLFDKSAAFSRVDEAVKEAKRSQAKTRLRKAWAEKTGSRTPRDWSRANRTPILCLAPDEESGEARQALDAISRDKPSDAEVAVAESWLDRAEWLSRLTDKSWIDAAFKAKVMDRFAVLLPSVEETRDLLSEKVSPEAYDWSFNPDVKAMLEREARKRYDAGGGAEVAARIDEMDGESLKAWLKKLVRENMNVGIEIIGEDRR